MPGPLNITLDTSKVKTSIPQFAEQTYIKVRLEKIEQDHVEGKGDVVKFEYVTVDPAPSQDGGTILPGQLGSRIFDTVRLYGKDAAPGEIPVRAITELAKRQDAFLGTGDPDNKKGKPARGSLNEQAPQMLGQTAFLKMRNNRDPQYTNQEITEFKFPGDIAGA